MCQCSGLSTLDKPPSKRPCAASCARTTNWQRAHSKGVTWQKARRSWPRVQRHLQTSLVLGPEPRTRWRHRRRASPARLRHRQPPCTAAQMYELRHDGELHEGEERVWQTPGETYAVTVTLPPPFVELTLRQTRKANWELEPFVFYATRKVLDRPPPPPPPLFPSLPPAQSLRRAGWCVGWFGVPACGAGGVRGRRLWPARVVRLCEGRPVGVRWPSCGWGLPSPPL